MKTVKLFAIIIIMVIPFSSFLCKKEEDKIAKCKLTRVKFERPQGASVDITYTNDGKPLTMKIVGLGYTDRTYNYFGNTIVITHGDPGNQVRDTITVDDKGRPVNIRKYAFVPFMIDYQLQYTGDDLANVTVTRSISGIPYTAVTDYQDGNMVGYTYGGITYRYEYYTDRKVQAGDYNDIFTMLEYGINIYPHKNLSKGFEEPGAGISNFSYEFNDDGLITKATKTNAAGSGFITFQYQCE